MQCRLLLNIVVRKGPVILELLPCKNQSLLVRWDALLVLDLSLYIRNRIRRLNFKGNSLACQGFHKHLHLFSTLGVYFLNRLRLPSSKVSTLRQSRLYLCTATLCSGPHQTRNRPRPSPVSQIYHPTSHSHMSHSRP